MTRQELKKSIEDLLTNYLIECKPTELPRLIELNYNTYIGGEIVFRKDEKDVILKIKNLKHENKLTDRQRFIASCSNPYYDNFATEEEVSVAKQRACGKYWDDVEEYEYVSFSPSGNREFFPYEDHDTEDKKIAESAAKLWAKTGKRKG